MDPNGRVAVVTGAGSGIGRAIALLLGRAGARVVAADLNEQAAEETAQSIREAAGAALALRADVTVEDDVARMLSFARERFGGPDILCNNAGLGELPDELFGGGPGAGWRRLVDVNLAAVILGTRLGALAMRETGGGVIINTASMGGLLPMPYAPVYAATKAAVVHFTRSLAGLREEMNVRVNAICPSYVDTPLLWAGTEQQRRETEQRTAALGGALSPELIAEGVLELVRDDGRAGAILRATQARGLDYAREIHA